MSSSRRRFLAIAGARTLAFVVSLVVAYVAIAPVAFLARHPLLDPLAIAPSGHTWLTSPLAVGATLVGLLLLVLLPALAGANRLADAWLGAESGWPRRRPRLLVGLGLVLAGMILVRWPVPAVLVYVGTVLVLQAPWLAGFVVRRVPGWLQALRELWGELQAAWKAFLAAPVWERLRKALAARKRPPRGSDEA